MANIEQYTALFDTLDQLEDEKSSISKDIKVAKEAFAEEHNLNKKSVARAYRDYKQVKKDLAEFVLVDTESSSALELIISRLTNTNV